MRRYCHTYSVVKEILSGYFLPVTAICSALSLSPFLSSCEWDSPSPLRSFCLQVPTTHQRRSRNAEVISESCVWSWVSHQSCCTLWYFYVRQWGSEDSDCEGESLALKMETEHSSETLVSINRITRRKYHQLTALMYFYFERTLNDVIDINYNN